MSARRIKISEMVDWIMNNRRGKAFVGWTPIQIANELLYGIENGTMSYTTNDGGEITGVACADKLPRSKVLFVGNVLTTSREAIRTLVTRFKELFPGYNIEAERRGRLRSYDTTRLVNKLTLSMKGQQ